MHCIEEKWENGPLKRIPKAYVFMVKLHHKQTSYNNYTKCSTSIYNALKGDDFYTLNCPNLKERKIWSRSIGQAKFNEIR